MSQLTVDDLQGNRGRVRTERIVHVVLWGAAFFSVIISAAIVFSLFREAWVFITNVDWSTVVGPDAEGWFPRRGQYGVMTLIVGSLIVTVVSMLIAVPIGLATAVYLSEYASPRVRRVLKPAIEVLAGIPSVVIGFFALTFIAPDIIQQIWSTSPQQTMMAAGVGVGVLIIPIIASISEDAMAAVPDALREASYGMGARKITTVTRVVLPAAVSGLVAALIIGVSRAMGETMVVFLAAGSAGGSLSRPTRWSQA